MRAHTAAARARAPRSDRTPPIILRSSRSPALSLSFSSTLEAAINEVLPATDSFDDADFDATAHINRLFPTEDSLVGVEPHMAELHQQMAALDEEVLQTVRQQTSAGSSAPSTAGSPPCST